MSLDTFAPAVVDVPPDALPARQAITLYVVMDVQPDGMGGRYLPDTAELMYHRHPGEPWAARVQLTGPRIHARTGRLSRKVRITRTYWPTDTVDLDRYPTRLPIPDFLTDHVTHYWPQDGA